MIFYNLLKKKKLRIITNRYRKEDGELAGQNLINSLKKEKIYKTVPILLYCGNISVVSHIQKPKKFIFVTEDTTEAIKVGSFSEDLLNCSIS